MSLDEFLFPDKKKEVERIDLGPELTYKRPVKAHRFCTFYRETYDGYRCVLMPPEKYKYTIECSKKEPNCELYKKVILFSLTSHG